MANREWRIQLKDASTGQAIIAAGGVCYVSEGTGDPAKATLYDKDGAALSNPVALTRGFINFFAVDTTESVDLFIQCPGGQFVTATAVKPSGPNEILVDTQRKDHVMVIPFAMEDLTAATETDTGFDEPTYCVFTADSDCTRVKVTAIDATETIDVGTATADSGDPDGFMSAVSVGTAGIIHDASTVGALLTTLVGYTVNGTAKSIVITLTAGSDTAEGYVYLPYKLFTN